MFVMSTMKTVLLKPDIKYVTNWIQPFARGTHIAPFLGTDFHSGVLNAEKKVN